LCIDQIQQFFCNLCIQRLIAQKYN
jgi:hypothetical protein